MNRANIEILIDRLTLQGVVVDDPQRMREAVVRELTRLFAEQGTPESLMRRHNRASLECGRVMAKPEIQGHDMVTQIAQQVYRGLSENP